MNKKESIEWLLEDAFRPVAPRQEYISAAKQRVLNTPPASNVALLYLAVLGFVGFATGLILIIAGVRILRMFSRA